MTPKSYPNIAEIPQIATNDVVLPARDLRGPVPILWVGPDEDLMQVIQSNLRPFYHFHFSSCADAVDLQVMGGFCGGVYHVPESLEVSMSSLVTYLPWIVLCSPETPFEGEKGYSFVFVQLPLVLSGLKELLDQQVMVERDQEQQNDTPWTLDSVGRILKGGGYMMKLTELETKLVAVLMNPQDDLSFQVLRQQVWDYAPFTTLETMESAVTRIQKKVAVMGLKLQRPQKIGRML